MLLQMPSGMGRIQHYVASADQCYIVSYKFLAQSSLDIQTQVVIYLGFHRLRAISGLS